MNFADLSSLRDLAYLVPEAIVALAILGMVALDLVVSDKRLVAWTGFALTLVAFGAALHLHRLVGPAGAPVHIFWGYVVDRFAVFFKLLILAAGAIALLFAANDRTPGARNVGEFHYLLLAMVFAMLVLVSATDLILIYVAIEFLSLMSYILVGFRKTSRSSEGALKYFLIGAVSSGCMLFGMSYLYGLSGVTDLVDLAPLAPAIAGQPLFLIGAVLILVGFGFKLALVPFHFWSPDAYEVAPTPVTALLSVGPKCAGFAIFARVFFTLFPAFATSFPAIVTVIGVATMTLGNTAAIFQTDIKRMLAYSSIAQAGYVFIGVAAGARFGLHGMLYYLFAYVFMNLGAFAVVLAFENRTRSTAIASYAGSAARHPWLSAALLVFLLGLAGIPPTSGFIGKYFLFLGALETRFYGLALAGILNSVVSVYYYFAVVKRMYFEAPPEAEAESAVGMPLHATVAACLAVTLAAGLFPELFNRFTLGALKLF